MHPLNRGAFWRPRSKCSVELVLNHPELTQERFPTMSLTLAQRKNIRDYAEKNKTHLESLKARRVVHVFSKIEQPISQDLLGFVLEYHRH